MWTTGTACTSASLWECLEQNAPARQDTGWWTTGLTVTQKVSASFFMSHHLNTMTMAPKSSRCDSSSLSILAEFPCGRTVLASMGAAFTRSLHDHENSTLQNATSPSSLANTTAVPSTPASTTTSFPDTNDSADIESQKKPPWKADSDDEMTNAGPVKPRIVGGDVVALGEIPWQVRFGGSRVKHEACVALLQQMHERKQTAGAVCSMCRCSQLFSFLFR